MSDFVSDLALGDLLKIIQDNGVYPQLSQDSKLWDFVQRVHSKGPDQGKELHYRLGGPRGVAAVQFTGFVDGKYPRGQRAEVSTAIAKYKDIDYTVEYDESLQKRMGSDLLQYADQIAYEMEQKHSAARRILCSSLAGDGSGAYGIVVSASVNAGVLSVVLSSASGDAGRSNVGWFQHSDVFKVADDDGTARLAANAAGNNITRLKVVDVDPDTDTVKFTGFESNTSDLTITGVGTIVAGDLLYRREAILPDLTASITDYNALSHVWPGLESLSADDGRVVNGITMSGITAGSRTDCGGAALSGHYFRKLLTKIKLRAGENAHKYTKAMMHPFTRLYLMDGASNDRQFFNITDVMTGAQKIGVHDGDTTIEFTADEHVPKQRIYMLSNDKTCLEFHGRDFKKTHEVLKRDSDGRAFKQIECFYSGSGTALSKKPSGIGVLVNFDLPSES